MVSLSNDVAIAYDPTRSNAFSLIGNSGPFPRYGYPELVRVNTGIQYRLEYGNFRVAGLAQVGNGYALGNGSMGEYEAQIGATFGGFSADAVVRYAKDAVSLQTFSGSELPAGYNPASILQATLANVAAVLVAAKYKWDRAEIYGGYTYARLANPSDAFPNGFHTIARGIFVPPGETNATYYDVNQIMHTFWAGAKYDVWTNLSVAASFTYQRQNDFLPAPAICTGSGINTSSPRCAGSQSAISFLIDYKPFARADLYGGVMVSNVYGGLASGYFKPQNIDPTVGLRMWFDPQPTRKRARSMTSGELFVVEGEARGSRRYGCHGRRQAADVGNPLGIATQPVPVVRNRRRGRGPRARPNRRRSVLVLSGVVQPEPGDERGDDDRDRPHHGALRGSRREIARQRNRQADRQRIPRAHIRFLDSLVAGQL